MSTVVVQGRLHPVAVLVYARRFIGASLIPVVALLVSAGTKVIVPIVLVALFVGLPLAVLSWWRFRYVVSGGRLELHSGVFSRSVRTIPLERVRGIDVTEPFVHRLFGLVKVDVEAAAGGDSKAELSLAAISRAQQRTCARRSSAEPVRRRASPRSRLPSTGRRRACSCWAGSRASATFWRRRR